MSNFVIWWDVLLVGTLFFAAINAVCWTALWLFMRWREERNARVNHVCWVDDTLCTKCGGYASYAEYRDSLV